MGKEDVMLWPGVVPKKEDKVPRSLVQYSDSFTDCATFLYPEADEQVCELVVCQKLSQFTRSNPPPSGHVNQRYLEFSQLFNRFR